MPEALTKLADELWVADAPKSFLGWRGQIRMTVVRLPEQRLFLHSPVPATDELRSLIESIGEPAFIAAPNPVHHLYVGEWSGHYPKARVHLAPGLPRRRPALRCDGVLGETAHPGWSSDLKQLDFSAARLYREIAFLHIASGTLILTDMVTNLTHLGWTPGAILLRWSGGWEGFRPCRPIWLMIRDRTLAREQMNRILAWDFDRIVMSHGEILDRGGKAALASAFARL